MRIVRAARKAESSAKRDKGPAVYNKDSSTSFPSLSARQKEHAVSLTIRLPLSSAEHIEAVCKQHHVDKSTLVRDFIHAGLSRLMEQKEMPSKTPTADVAFNSLNPFEDLAGTWTFGSADQYVRELRKDSE